MSIAVEFMMRKPTKSGKLKGKTKKKGTKKRKSKSRDASVEKSKKAEVDILSPAAMLNAHYICHDVSDCLEKRGFNWPGGKGKKGKKGKKKRKKKK